MTSATMSTFSGHGCIPIEACLGEPSFVVNPQRRLLGAQKIEVVPREYARFVAIRKPRLHRVIAHGIEANNIDRTFASLQHFLSCAVALDFCRR